MYYNQICFLLYIFLNYRIYAIIKYDNNIISVDLTSCQPNATTFQHLQDLTSYMLHWLTPKNQVSEKLINKSPTENTGVYNLKSFSPYKFSLVKNMHCHPHIILYAF